ncbi:MAG: hypothetical protein WAM91_04500 [Candidatus Acidiferrales bacterium]
MSEQTTIVSKSSNTSRPPRQRVPAPGNRCSHKDAAGRQCRNLALRSTGSRTDHNKSGLCTNHATHERQILDTRAVAEELLSTAPPAFDTAVAVNHMLGKLLRIIVEDRIPLRKGAVLVYACSLLLNSLGGVRTDVLGAYGPEFLKAMAQGALDVMDGDGAQDAEQDVGQDVEASRCLRDGPE